MPTLFAAELHIRNRRVLAGLAHLQPGSSATIRPNDLADLRAELSSVGAKLRSLPPGQSLDADEQREVSEYHRHLQCLRQLLPYIHQRLLTEKARLEGARSRVAATAAWADISRRTL